MELELSRIVTFVYINIKLWRFREIFVDILTQKIQKNESVISKVNKFPKVTCVFEIHFKKTDILQFIKEIRILDLKL